MALKPIDTEKVKKELEKKFDEFDKDKSGFIDEKELEGLLLKSGYKTTPDERKKLMTEMDKSKDGKLSKEEFVKVLLATIDSVRQEEAMLRRAFEYMDKDKSGKIDIKEYIALYKEVGKTLSEDQAKFLMKDLDKDNSGTVDFDEFLAAYTRSKRRMR